MCWSGGNVSTKSAINLRNMNLDIVYIHSEKFSKVSSFNLEVRLQSAVVTQSKFVGRILTRFFPTILNSYCNCNTITFVRCTIFQLENVIITFDDGVYTSAIN